MTIKEKTIEEKMGKDYPWEWRKEQVMKLKEQMRHKTDGIDYYKYKEEVDKINLQIEAKYNAEQMQKQIEAELKEEELEK